MKTPPPHGLVCAAGVFVLGRYCPYSGESCRCTEARWAVCQRRRKCHLPGTLLAPSVPDSSPASALPNKNAAFVRGKPGRGRRAVFIRLRRNSPLRCWSGTQLRPDSPARWSPAQRCPPHRGYSPSRQESSPRADPAHCGQSSQDRGASPWSRGYPAGRGSGVPGSPGSIS